MPWGQHNSKADAYTAASSIIRQLEPLKTQASGMLAAKVTGAALDQLWRTARACANDLANIRALVPDVVDYAKSQHPSSYDIAALWLAAESSYGAIANAVEAVLLDANGVAQREQIVAGAARAFEYSAAVTAPIKAAVDAAPDIKAGIAAEAPKA